MSGNGKLKKRGFVMTGGGAKGLYEAGVIHAFHITGMEFDVITGSSIGAINAIVYAEYLLRKRGLAEAVRSQPEQAVEAMDDFVKAYHYAWLQLEDLNLIDDGEGSALARLRDDLASFDLNLPMLTRLLWWYTSPEEARASVPWRDLCRLLIEGAERVGLAGVPRVWREVRDGNGFANAFLTAYLERLGLDRALVLPMSEAENRLRRHFSGDALVLRPEHLDDGYQPSEDGAGRRVRLLESQRLLGEYHEAGIEVRLTRANYRTGRLENSAHTTAEAFVAYLDNQAWRLETASEKTPPLGSHRLQLPGNPIAVNAALASGRFPGVFVPMHISEIYPLDHPDNHLLGRILANWLDDSEVESQLFEAYRRRHPGEADPRESWDRLYSWWRDSKRLRDFFPRSTDAYVDGGAIDNTPTNSAVDAVREWAERCAVSKRDVVLDLYVVLLHPEPALEMEESDQSRLHETVARTLQVRNAANLSSDAAVVETINTFGRRAEELGEGLRVVLELLGEVGGAGDPAQKQALEAQLRQRARARGLEGFLGPTAEGIFDRLEKWADEQIERRLPLHVDVVKIHPDTMPMGTLQFTQRLGYRKQNAIQMLAMGCYNTLWSMRSYFEEHGSALDDEDRHIFERLRRWMEIAEWPKEHQEQEQLRQSWRCRRTACSFHARHCPHGARANGA